MQGHGGELGREREMGRVQTQTAVGGRTMPLARTFPIWVHLLCFVVVAFDGDSQIQVSTFQMRTRIQSSLPVKSGSTRLDPNQLSSIMSTVVYRNRLGAASSLDVRPNSFSLRPPLPTRVRLTDSNSVDDLDDFSFGLPYSSCIGLRIRLVALDAGGAWIVSLNQNENLPHICTNGMYTASRSQTKAGLSTYIGATPGGLICGGEKFDILASAIPHPLCSCGVCCSRHQNSVDNINGRYCHSTYVFGTQYTVTDSHWRVEFVAVSVTTTPGSCEEELADPTVLPSSHPYSHATPLSAPVHARSDNFTDGRHGTTQELKKTSLYCGGG
ncbi:hypothetical protein BDY19DRAFT_1049076 [Irpex rosettiformis]|uniref:Uncharacterized protein n=1 Tax=Irpex rosettiformis TaxID=378272 RepID=A0ACB8U073_9APHY|nr:hypothetical protein BDY19DRAFT_1049076 [Irpex rosettiformis]